MSRTNAELSTSAGLLDDLPGHDLIETGLRDLAAGVTTVAALLATLSRPRLVRAGLWPHPTGALPSEPERQLYRLLGEEGGDAYSRYSSLLRELASFENTLDRRLTKLKSHDGKSEIGNGKWETETRAETARATATQAAVAWPVPRPSGACKGVLQTALEKR